MYKKCKIINKYTWIYECNIITQRSPTCFGHSCGRLQSDKNNNVKKLRFELTQQ